MNTWQIRETRWNPAAYAKHETLFSLSNGYMGSRGSFEEKGLSAGHDGFYLNGFYETYPLSYGEAFSGYPSESQAMVNLPDPKRLRLRIDGEAPDYQALPPQEYERTLDLRRGLLSRVQTWRNSRGTELRMEAERFVSAARPHLLCLRYRFTAETACALELFSGYDLNSHNLTKKEDPRVGVEFTAPPVCDLETRERPGGTALAGKIRRSGLRFRSAMVHKTEGAVPEEKGVLREEDFYGTGWELSLAPGETFVLEKYVWYEGLLPGRPAVPEELEAAAAAGYEALREEHGAWWEKAWEGMDVSIRGDEAMQQGIRFNMFHLLQSVGKDGRTNMAAKGMTGEGYEGHYFWDTEIYMIPFFTFTRPEVARALLEYRHAILDAAKARAREMGHKQGALFPWRTISGPECSSYYPAGTAQYHISSDVAHAVKVYWEGTGDEEFLLNQGLELLAETARLWADMAVFDEDAGGYAIQNVTGPDEYTALVDNNFYTNRMAADQLRFTRRVLTQYRTLAETDPKRAALEETLRSLQVSPEEEARWSELAEGIYLPYDKKRGLTPQDDRFLAKPRWDLAATPADRFPLLLHYHPLTLYRYQVCKQPDVVLAQFLLSSQFSMEQKERDYDYYEKITTHDSSLSPCIYGCMAGEIGRVQESYDYYVKTARTDLDDFHGNVKDGVHAANMAGSWIGLAYGFARMRHHRGRLSFSPLRPPAWESYGFRLQKEGSLLSVLVEADRTVYRLLSGEPVSLIHEGEEGLLTEELVFPAARKG